MSNFTSFAVQTISGLGIELGYTTSTDKTGSEVKTVVIKPDVPARVNRKGAETEVSFSRKAVTAISQALESLKGLDLPADKVNQFALSQVSQHLGSDVAAAITDGQHASFVSGIEEMLEAYDEEMAPEGATGQVDPSNALMNFVCASVPVSEWPTLTPETLTEKVTLHFAKAMVKAQAKVDKNGIKPNGLAIMKAK